MSTDPDLRVAIIGGGITGLCLATGLLKHPHVDFRIYEAASEFSEIGAGAVVNQCHMAKYSILTLPTVGPNARQAMEMLGPTLFNAFLDTTTPNLWPERANNYITHKLGYGENAGQYICTPLSRGGQQSVHRAKFLEEIAKGIPDERSSFNKRLIAIEEPNDTDPIILRFADGTSETADAVLGADGIRSFVRKYVLGPDHPAAQPVFAGSVSYRRLVTMDLAVAKLGAEHAQNATILIGPGKLMLTYPLDHGEAINIICSDFTQTTWDQEEWTRPATREELDERYEGWGAQAQAIIDLMFVEPGMLAWAMHDHLPAPSYYSGRVAILGDSAHASVPYQGNGAAQGIEDALVLEALLGQAKTVKHIVKAFAAYDQIRRPRSQRLAETSRECGLLYAMQIEGIEDDLEKIKENLMSRYNWIWNRDMVEQNRAALELFDESLRPTLDEAWLMNSPVESKHHGAGMGSEGSMNGIQHSQQTVEPEHNGEDESRLKRRRDIESGREDQHRNHKAKLVT